MTDELIRCARALVGGEERNDFAFAVRGGRIARAGTYREIAAEGADLPVRSFPKERLIVPGFVNGHSHAYQILLRGWADDLPFERWRSEALYRVVPQLTADDVYWTFAQAFSEMLAAGITTVAEFFYLNGEGNERAEAAIRAARDTGIRLVFARTWMDASYAPPQFRESIEDATHRTADLMERYPEANVCVAPHSLHAASPEMIRAAYAFARERDCAMHLHLAEAAYEREQVVERYGLTPVRLLREWGVLDERLVAIHAIYADDEEKDLLAAAGARVVHNPMTNQYLGDGTCDTIGLLARGVTMGLGTDADVRPSIFDEMRAASLLQKLAHRDGSVLPARDAFALGTASGARALGLAGGDFRVGDAADYVVLDTTEIDPWSPAVNALVMRGSPAWVRATFVGGSRVYTGEASPLARRAKEEAEKIARAAVEARA
jgi:5-methylthioadenosine/S-adenosylhomocysteine deaminase